MDEAEGASFTMHPLQRQHTVEMKNVNLHKTTTTTTIDVFHRLAALNGDELRQHPGLRRCRLAVRGVFILKQFSTQQSSFQGSQSLNNPEVLFGNASAYKCELVCCTTKRPATRQRVAARARTPLV